jgi:hypothetical protein
MNLTAYATADDLAQGLQSAEPLQPIAEEFADWIKEKVSKPNSNPRIELNRNTLLDTAAFVTIVSEAQKAKTSPLNASKIKEMIALLERVVAEEDSAVSNIKLRRRENYSALHTYRAHLLSARGLLE